MSLTIGKTIGPYRVTAKLGEGGMGVVYRAEDERLARPVAIKFLTGLALQDPRAGERLLREARAASSLNHRNICTIYDVGEHEGATFLVMELLEGQTLASRIANGPLAEQEAIRVTAAVADALDAAHQRGIIHRDVKPANVFITERGEPKLLDFGLARSFGNAAGVEVTATNTGTTAGTVAYMSPEQARDEPLNARSDLFSLGATLYQIASGALPFAGASTALVFDAILNKHPRPPSQVNSQVSSELERIILRALEKDPHLRYQTAGDLRADLQRLLRTESAQVAAAPPPPRQRWPLLIAAAAVMAAAALGYLVWRDQPPTDSGPLTIEQVTDSGDVVTAAISDDGKYVATAEQVTGGYAVVVRQVQTKAAVTVIPAGPQRNVGLAFSRDGAYLYVTTFGPASLLRMAALGGPTTKLLDDDIATAVGVSPDGRQLAYVRAKNNEAELVVVAADGSNPRAIGVEKRPPMGVPAWSPDGQSIAWPQVVLRADAAITVTSADGTRKERITIAGWQYIDSVTWLPTGRGFVVNAEDPSRELTGRHQILEVSHPGGVVKRLTNDLSDYHNVVGNPATALAAVPIGVRSGILIGSLTAADTLRRVGTGGTDGARGLAWTPDGQIAFADMYSTGWIMKDDGSGLRPLLSERQTAATPFACGARIGYTAARGQSVFVFVLDPNASTPRHLAEMPFIAGMPTCTPDGAWLLYTDHGETIKKVPVAGGESVIVVKDATDPRVSPDGTLLAARARRGGPDAFVVASLTDPSQIRRLPGPVGGAYQWDLDSKALIHSRGTGNVDNLWRFPIDGSPARQITAFTSDLIFHFALARDGRLAIARGERANDVVVLRR